MRGLIAGVLVLTFLDVALKTTGSRLATALVVPTTWLAKWMDPNTPLIATDQRTPVPPAAAPGSPVNPAPNGNAPLPGFNLGPIHLPIL